MFFKPTYFHSRGLALLVSLGLLVSACTRPSGLGLVATASGIGVWIDQPFDGTSLPFAPFTLKAHATDASGGGIRTIAFLISSGGAPAVTLGSVPTDPSAALVNGELAWNPSAPGEYLIQAQAFNSTGYLFSVPARVCVSQDGQANTCGQGQPPATGSGKIGGLVYKVEPDGSNPHLLEGALVTLSGCVTPPQNQTTPGDGTFVFDRLPGGTCSLEAAGAGLAFYGWSALGSTTINTTYPVPVTSDSTTPVGLSIFLVPQTSPTPQTSGKPSPTPTATPKPQQGVTPTKTPPAPLPTKTVAPTTLPPTATFTATSVPATATFTATNVPPTATFTPEPPSATPTAIKPSDTAGPSISPSAKPNPANYGDNCSNASAGLNAVVSDPAGVSSVQIFYRYENDKTVGGWQGASVTDFGGGNYGATIDNNAGGQAYGVLGGTDGSIRWYVLATDSLGNPSNSGEQLVTLQYCLG